MARTDWFTHARFGLFLHWGLYALPAKGEWSYAYDDWAPGEYEALAERFNPTEYDPQEWARLARAAGMRYAVLTTRHHDGFCMFDSHYTPYRITNTPYGRDVTRMYADAFRAEGLRVGFYHSLPDWTHPGYADRESPEFIRHGVLHTPTPEQHRAFQTLLYNHVEQLMTEYGKIDLLFLDYTSKFKANEDYFDRERLLEMVYRRQPDILVNDRLSYFKENARDYDYYTPEICILNQPQTVRGKPVAWETCATMNRHWGYCADDTAYKPVETMLAGLMGCVSQDGNLLLNIGPEPTGKFPPPAVDRLRELSAWMLCNGEAVYGCGKSEFPAPYGCCYTQKDRSIYCCFLIPPMGDVILPGLKNKIERIVHLRTGKEVKQVDFWGYELLKPDEIRIRPGDVKTCDVLRIDLKV